MKEWHVLLDYIHSYVYNHDTEEIMIKNSPDASKALALYQKMLKDYSMETDEYLKWSFDIAIDCVRKMDYKDRQYLTHSYEVDFRVYGTFVRNEYIHCAVRHRYYSCADKQSSIVMGLIYTILHNYYNYFNEELCELLHNFTYKDIVKKYSDKFTFIEEYTLQLTEPGCELTATEVLNKISKRIRKELGAEEFKNIFIEVIKECGAIEYMRPTLGEDAARDTLEDVNSGRVRESTIEKYLYTDETKEEYTARLRAEYADLD